MDKAQFWQLIEDSQNKKRDCEKQATKLERLLMKLDAEEIVSFDNIFASLLVESYRWDLWAVAYIVNGGCSNDGFEYFQRWLIGQGQEHFEAALRDPERAADGVKAGAFCECEELGYAAQQAYESKTEQDDIGEAVQDLDYPKKLQEPAGQRWNEEELKARFPRLWAKFE